MRELSATSGFLCLVAQVFLAPLPVGVLHGQARILHPSRESLRRSDIAKEVSRSDLKAQSASLNRVASRLRTAKVSARIGTLDGPPETVLGLLSDVAVSSDGNVFALDLANQFVRVFDTSGAALGQIGRSGSGPHEFRTPLFLDIPSQGSMRVVDAVLGVKTFQVRNGRAEGNPSIVPLKVAPLGGCLSGESLFALAPTSGAGKRTTGDTEPVAVKIDLRAGEERWFGDSYPSSTPLVRRIMSEGTIACLRSGRSVLALSKLPFVTVFDEAGQPQGTVRLSDFEIGYSAERVNSRGQAAIGLDPGTQRFSYVQRIVPLDASVVAVQVAQYVVERRPGAFPEASIDTYLLDTSTMDAVYVSNGLPYLVNADGGEVWGFINSPYPQVLKLTAP